MYLVSQGEPEALVELEPLLKVELVGVLELVAQAGRTLSYCLGASLTERWLL